MSVLRGRYWGVKGFWGDCVGFCFSKTHRSAPVIPAKPFGKLRGNPGGWTKLGFRSQGCMGSRFRGNDGC